MLVISERLYDHPVYYLRSLKFTLRHLKRSYMFRSHYHPQGAYIISHAARHTTHTHNQAHYKHRTTHTQKHDMLPQHQVNITK